MKWARSMTNMRRTKNKENKRKEAVLKLGLRYHDDIKMNFHKYYGVK